MVYLEKLQLLKGMGYSENDATRALEIAIGDMTIS
jgi:hypothetical protein